MHQSVDALASLALLHGVHTVQREGVLVGNILLDEEDQRGDDDGDDGDGGCKAVAAADLVDELGIEDDGEGAVALADEHRGAEVCKGAHEHQQSCGQQGGHDKGHDYLEEAGNARAAEVLSRLDEGVVDVLQRALGVEEHQWEQLERHDQHDAAEAVDVRDGNAEVLEEGGDDAAAAQQQDPRVGTDEGGRHGCHHDEDVQHALALDLKDREQVGQRGADGDGEHRRRDGHLEAVDEGIEIVALGEELGEISQREAAGVGVHHRLPDEVRHRVKQEQRVEGDRCQRDGTPDIKTELIIVFHKRRS